MTPENNIKQNQTKKSQISLLLLQACAVLCRGYVLLFTEWLERYWARFKKSRGNKETWQKSWEGWRKR